jgi:hypothetical protein
MSILMSGEDCRSCRWSFTVTHNYMPRRRCAKLKMWVKDHDYCKSEYEKRDDKNVSKVS